MKKLSTILVAALLTAAPLWADSDQGGAAKSPDLSAGNQKQGIEQHSFSNGAENPSGSQMGSGGGAGKVSLSDIKTGNGKGVISGKRQHKPIQITTNPGNNSKLFKSATGTGGGKGKKPKHHPPPPKK